MLLSFRRTLALAVLTGIPIALDAQGPVREIPIGTANATGTFEFSLIRTVRELPNGSLLVAAPMDGSLLRLDPTLQRTDTVGRTGHGPGEYIQPDGIWPLPADSSLLVDLGNNRLYAMDARGKFGNTMPIMAGSPTPGPGGGAAISAMIPGGVDRSGAIYFRGQPTGDSMPLFRYDRATKKSTQVALLKAPASSVQESGDATSRSQRMSPVPLSPTDGWAVTSTGTLYLVRSGDYHVDVVPAQGARVKGPAVAHTAVKIGDAEKKEYSAQVKQNGGLSIGVESRNGEVSFSLSRGRGGRGGDGPTPVFPATKPPFDASQIFVDAKSRLWVARHQAAGRPALYDVFDTRGILVASVRFPAGRAIVGMGATSVYVAHTNEDDLQLLERYALPL